MVTPQLQEQFGKALKLVRGAVHKNASYAAYLHGSFGDRPHRPRPAHRGDRCSAQTAAGGPQLAGDGHRLAAPALLRGTRGRGRTRQMGRLRSAARTVLHPAPYRRGRAARRGSARVPDPPGGGDAGGGPGEAPGGGPAGRWTNATLAASLPSVVLRHRTVDDRFTRLRDDVTPQAWRAAVEGAGTGLTLPDVDPHAVRGLKFSEALPARLAETTLTARCRDSKGARAALAEPVRFSLSVGG